MGGTLNPTHSLTVFSETLCTIYLSWYVTIVWSSWYTTNWSSICPSQAPNSKTKRHRKKQNWVFPRCLCYFPVQLVKSQD